MAGKILIVDDDSDTINFLKLLLTRQGYEVLVAYNGMKALELAHSHSPDLIVLDVMMPDLDGYEVARSLRGHPETALTPILMFTAKNKIEDKLSGFESGVDIYLTKPIHPVELQANIKSLMSQRKIRTSSLKDKGYIVGVTAAKGGLGVSTVALNLAITYQQKYKVKVIGAEMKPGQGSWAQELGVTNPDGLVNLLRSTPPEITPGAVEKQLQISTWGIRMLLASTKTSDVQYLMATVQYEAILQGLAELSPLVVLDIGTNFLPAFDRIVDLCQEIVLVVEPQPGATKRTRELIDELRVKGYGSSKVLTVVTLNHTRADMVLSVSQIEEILGHKVALGFPPANEQVHHASLRCLPLIMVQPEGLSAQQFTKLAEHLAHRVPQ
jgi:CheY-like chemotaxis protein/MinD-like ATPase involved in chromosome partitioning or flagellar assembly